MGVSYSSTFPADPPVDHDLPVSVAEHDQRAFDQLEQVLSHWDRPRSRSYHWLISLDQHTDVLDLSQQCQEVLPKTGLSHIPAASVHLTVRRVGAVESVSPDDLEGSVSVMTQHCRTASAFRLQVMPLAGSPGAVRFSVAPWSPLLDLWRVAGIAGAGNPAPLQHYRPHIGIAYSNQVQPEKPLIAAVQQARALPPVEAVIGEVQLVELYRTNDQYCWHTLERVPLGKDGASGRHMDHLGAQLASRRGSDL